MTETNTTTVVEATSKPKTKKRTSKKSTAKKQTKSRTQDIVQEVSESLREVEAQTATTNKVATGEELTGEVFYSGKFKPAASEEMSSSDGGRIRVMKETWSYEDRGGNQKQSTKIAVRPVYRRRDGNLFFAEPIVNIHESKWSDFMQLMRSIKA